MPELFFSFKYRGHNRGHRSSGGKSNNASEWAITFERVKDMLQRKFNFFDLVVVGVTVSPDPLVPVVALVAPIRASGEYS